MDEQTALRIALEVFPEFDPTDERDKHALIWRLWHRTNYPCFWDTDDPETELRQQLEKAKREW